MSYARRHFEKTTAEIAAAEAGGADLGSLSAYQRLLKNLHDDKVLLKSVSSIADKVHIKKQALPAYQEWIDGITAAGTVQADDRIAATVIVWMIDCGLLDEAMPLADVLIHSGLESADEYSRSMPEIIVEQMADQIESGSEISAESLKTLIEWATAKKEDGLHEINLADVIRAKLLKAAGEKAEAADDNETALNLYRQAVGYNDKAGVKKRIEALEKQLAF
ncbi:MAG: terminase [Neisseria sp.]|nr:MAG: terminase [Neisseria sp.]